MSLGIADLLSMSQGGVAGIGEDPWEPVAFPLFMPALPSYKRLRLIAQHSVSASKSPFSYQSQIQPYSNEMWRAEVSLPEMTREQAEQWMSWILLLNGQVGTFLLGDPLGKNPRGSAIGTPEVAVSNQTGKTLDTRGWAISTANLLLPGDYIQIGERLYKNLRAITSDSAGYAKLDIWPRLRESPAQGTAIVLNNCKGLFRLQSSTVDIAESVAGGIYSIAFSAEESL
jgi:hypothetical protein